MAHLSQIFLPLARRIGTALANCSAIKSAKVIPAVDKRTTACGTVGAFWLSFANDACVLSKRMCCLTVVTLILENVDTSEAVVQPANPIVTVTFVKSVDPDRSTATRNKLHIQSCLWVAEHHIPSRGSHKLSGSDCGRHWFHQQSAPSCLPPICKSHPAMHCIALVGHRCNRRQVVVKVLCRA